MPIPRTLFDPSTPQDHDLTVTQGRWPVDLGGELVLSAPHPDTFDGPHPFFGEGMTYRLSLDAGTHGAPDGAFAWRQKRIDSPSARLRAAAPRRVRRLHDRRPVARSAWSTRPTPRPCRGATGCS